MEKREGKTEIYLSSPPANWARVPIFSKHEKHINLTTFSSKKLQWISRQFGGFIKLFNLLNILTQLHSVLYILLNEGQISGGKKMPGGGHSQKRGRETNEKRIYTEPKKQINFVQSSRNKKFCLNTKGVCKVWNLIPRERVDLHFLYSSFVCRAKWRRNIYFACFCPKIEQKSGFYSHWYFLGNWIREKFGVFSEIEFLNKGDMRRSNICCFSHKFSQYEQLKFCFVLVFGHMCVKKSYSVTIKQCF